MFTVTLGHTHSSKPKPPVAARAAASTSPRDRAIDRTAQEGQLHTAAHAEVLVVGPWSQLPSLHHKLRAHLGERNPRSARCPPRPFRG